MNPRSKNKNRRKFAKAIVASNVHITEKGVGFKVTCQKSGETFWLFTPNDRLKGENLLKMGNRVKVDLGL